MSFINATETAKTRHDDGSDVVIAIGLMDWVHAVCNAEHIRHIEDPYYISPIKHWDTNNKFWWHMKQFRTYILLWWRLYNDPKFTHSYAESIRKKQNGNIKLVFPVCCVNEILDLDKKMYQKIASPIDRKGFKWIRFLKFAVGNKPFTIQPYFPTIVESYVDRTIDAMLNTQCAIFNSNYWKNIAVQQTVYQAPMISALKTPLISCMAISEKKQNYLKLEQPLRILDNPTKKHVVMLVSDEYFEGIHLLFEKGYRYNKYQRKTMLDWVYKNAGLLRFDHNKPSDAWVAMNKNRISMINHIISLVIIDRPVEVHVNNTSIINQYGTAFDTSFVTLFLFTGLHLFLFANFLS